MEKTAGWVVSVLGIFWLSFSVNHEAAMASDPTSIFRYGQQSIGVAAGHGLALPVGGSASGDLRYHHISNASIHRNNSGINSSVVLVGLTVFLRK